MCGGATETVQMSVDVCVFVSVDGAGAECEEELLKHGV